MCLPIKWPSIILQQLGDYSMKLEIKLSETYERRLLRVFQL